jgi:hypothetical protein
LRCSGEIFTVRGQLNLIRRRTTIDQGLSHRVRTTHRKLEVGLRVTARISEAVHLHFQSGLRAEHLTKLCKLHDHLRIKLRSTRSKHHVGMQTLRKFIEHFIPAGTLTRHRQFDARVDELLLELCNASFHPLRGTHVIAPDPADHESHGGTDRPAHDRTRRRTCDTADFFFLRKLVRLRRLSCTTQRHHHRNDH